jgi:hypothetical protein
MLPSSPLQIAWPLRRHTTAALAPPHTTHSHSHSHSRAHTHKMKLLDNPQFSRLGAALSGAHMDARLLCRLESYSCKMAGDDKKLFKQISSSGNVDDLELLSPISPGSLGPQYSGSPSDGTEGAMTLHHTCSRKTLYYLKATLNAAFFPDYDFGQAKSSEFSREPSYEWVSRNINAILHSAIGEEYLSVAPSLWASLGNEINPAECTIYSYNPDMESDPFSEEGSLWSFAFFFYNKKMKRIVFFSCHAVR